MARFSDKAGDLSAFEWRGLGLEPLNCVNSGMQLSDQIYPADPVRRLGDQPAEFLGMAASHLFQPSRRRTFAATSLTASTGLQPTGRALRPLVPTGLAPDQHWQRACFGTEHPLAQLPNLPPKLLQAAEHLESLGGGIVSWRKEQMKRIRHLAESLQPVQAQWQQGLHPQVRRIIGKWHLPLLHILAKEAGSEDLFFPKQFTVGVLNSILKCVRLVSGAVSASGRFVFQVICLPIHLSPRSCVRGCVRLRGICLPIHLSPRSCVRGCVRLRGICLPIHLSALCQGLCPPPDDLSPNSFVSQFICLPGPCLPIHLSPRSCGRGCVRLRGIGFPIHLSPNSFVSQALCQGLCPPPGDLSPNSFVRLVSGAVSASGRFVFQFICLPIHLSPRSCVRGCVRLRGICLPIHLSALCQGLCPPPDDLSPNSFVRLVSGAVSASGGFVSQFICLPIHLSPRSCVRGCVRLRGICLPIHLSALCQGLCPPPDDLSPNSFVSQFICLPGPCLPIHLSPRSCGRGCVRLRGIGFPIHLSPNSFVSQVLCQGLCPPPGDLSPNSFVRLVSGAVSASGRFVSQFICLPIHLSPRSLSPNSFVSQVLWQGLCPPLRDWFPNSFVSQFICLPGPVSGAVSASGGFVSQFICPPCVRGCVRPRTICLPIHLSPNSFVSQVLVSQFIGLPGPVAGAVSASGGLVSQFICLPIHLSPRSCVRGCVRLRGICLPIHLSDLYQGLCPPPDDLSSNSFVSQFICLPGPVSGAVSASGGFVSQFICLPIHLSPRPCVRGCVRLRGICLPIHLPALCQGLCPPPDDLSPNSFVSQFICLPGPCLPIHLSPRSCGRGCVRLCGIGFPIHLSPNSFVSQVLCQGLCPPPGDLSPNSFVRLVSGAVSASGRFVSQLICLPIDLSPRSLSPNSFVSQVLWQGLCPPLGDWFPNSFVSQVLCQGLCPPSGDLSPNSFVFHHSPNSLLLGYSILS